MAQFNFQVNQAALNEQRSYEPLPAGWYPVMIDESDVRPTRNGNGSYVWLAFRIIGENYAGRKLFGRYNVQNPNPTAQEIGVRELSLVAASVGLQAFQDTQQLHGIPLEIKIRVRKDTTGKYSDDNEIVDYRPAGGCAAAQAPVAAPAATPAWAGAQQPWASASAAVPPAPPAAPAAPAAPPAAPPAAVAPGAVPPAPPAAGGLPPWAQPKA